MIRKQCGICGASFSGVGHSDVNEKLYHHGIELHQGELRRAASRESGSTDPIWVADYLSNLTNLSETNE